MHSSPKFAPWPHNDIINGISVPNLNNLPQILCAKCHCFVQSNLNFSLSGLDSELLLQYIYRLYASRKLMPRKSGHQEILNRSSPFFTYVTANIRATKWGEWQLLSESAKEAFDFSKSSFRRLPNPISSYL